MGCFQALEVLKLASGQGCILWFPIPNSHFAYCVYLGRYAVALHQYFLPSHWDESTMKCWKAFFVAKLEWEGCFVPISWNKAKTNIFVYSLWTLLTSCLPLSNKAVGVTVSSSWDSLQRIDLLYHASCSALLYSDAWTRRVLQCFPSKHLNASMVFIHKWLMNL